MGRTDGGTGGRERPSLSVQTLPEMQKGRGEKKKKLIEKKSYRSVYVPKFGSYFAFFDLKTMLIVIKMKNNEKSVDLCY